MARASTPIPPAFHAAHAELTALLVAALREPDGRRRCEAAQAADKSLAALWRLIEAQHPDPREEPQLYSKED